MRTTLLLLAWNEFEGMKAMVPRFGNWMFTTILNILFGGRYTDTLSIFRAWRREILPPILPMHFPGRVGVEPYLSSRCAKEKCPVAEIPGDEPPRIGGARKMEVIKTGLAIVKLIFFELLISRARAKLDDGMAHA